MTAWYPLSMEQRREWVDLMQVYEAREDARARLAHYAGGMHWKTAKGRQYLVRTLGGRSWQKSLGPRSPDTEAQYRAFHDGKAAERERLRSLEQALKYRARVARAHGLGRVPRPLAEAIRSGDSSGCLVGPQALYAFEAMAGVQFRQDLLVGRTDESAWLPEAGGSAGGEEVPEWLLTAPRVTAKAIDTRGYPVALTAVEPRVFLLYRYGKTEEGGAGGAGKRELAEVVAAMIREFLPQYPMASEAEALVGLPVELRTVLPSLGVSVLPDGGPDDFPFGTPM